MSDHRARRARRCLRWFALKVRLLRGAGLLPRWGRARHFMLGRRSCMADELPPGCVCGHARFMHHRQQGQCMASTPNEAWVCDCSEWRPAIEARGAASIEDERRRLLRKGRAQHRRGYADEPTFDSPCEYGWGDFRCADREGHDPPHRLVWAGDEDDE